MSYLDYIPLYDFESQLEAAFKSYLESHELKTYIAGDNPETQMERPRVELQVMIGPATDHRSTHNNEFRPDSFAGQLQVSVITNVAATSDANATPMNDGAYLHAQYRALVRYVLAGLERWLKSDAATVLPHHTVNRLIEAGTTPRAQTQDGYYVSTINYDFHFNIRPESWPSAE